MFANFPATEYLDPKMFGPRRSPTLARSLVIHDKNKHHTLQVLV